MTNLPTVLYLVAGVILVLMAYRYTRYSDWRRYAAGRAFLYLLVSFLTLVVFVFARSAWPDAEFLQWSRPVLLAGLDLALAHLLLTIVRYQGGWRNQGTSGQRSEAAGELAKWGTEGPPKRAGKPGPHPV